MKPWTQQERDTANTMRAEGYARIDIAERLGRTLKAVGCFFDKADYQVAPTAESEPIGACHEYDRYKRNAIIGSQRLASAIQSAGVRP